MDGRVTPPKRVTSPTWDPPPPCKQALSFTNFREEKYPILKISLSPYSLCCHSKAKKKNTRYRLIVDLH